MNICYSNNGGTILINLPPGWKIEYKVEQTQKDNATLELMLPAGVASEHLIVRKKNDYPDLSPLLFDLLMRKMMKHISEQSGTTEQNTIDVDKIERIALSEIDKILE